MIDLVVEPSENAFVIGRVVARAIFRQNDEPMRLLLDEAEIAKVCAVAAQACFHAITEKSQ